MRFSLEVPSHPLVPQIALRATDLDALRDLIEYGAVTGPSRASTPSGVAVAVHHLEQKHARAESVLTVV